MSEAEVMRVVDSLVDALNQGDVVRALTHYAPDAVFYPEPGHRVDGIDAIRQALAGMAAMAANVVTLDRRVACQGDVALYQSHWQLSVGGTAAQQAVSADVLRRGPEGRWLIAIDNPWGEALLTRGST